MISVLEKYITGFIQEKQALGYVFKSEEKYLQNFDKFIAEQFHDAHSLTKEMIEQWVNRFPRSNCTKCRYYSILNGLGRYMIRCGYVTFFL